MAFHRSSKGPLRTVSSLLQGTSTTTVEYAVSVAGFELHVQSSERQGQQLSARFCALFSVTRVTSQLLQCRVCELDKKASLQTRS